MRFPMVDDALVGDVLDALGIGPDDDVEAIATAFRGWLPAGSTAKWAAVDRGETPPGADPSVALEARLGGSLESWSCWPICTGLGGVLSSLGHDVTIAVEHRRTVREVPLVDYHSVLVVDGSLLDPYLGPSAPVAPGMDVARTDGWASWIPGVRPDHLGAHAGGSVYRYRLLADDLDEFDVRAFCEISTTHSGVGRRRMAHWLHAGRLRFVREHDEGPATLQEATGAGGPFVQSRAVIRTGTYDELIRTIDERGGAT